MDSGSLEGVLAAAARRGLDFGCPADYRRLELPSPRAAADGSLHVPREGLEALARAAFSETAFRMPAAELEALATALADPAAAEAERFVAAELLRNAAIAAEGVLPLCQDTGTAVIHAWRGAEIRSDGEDAAALEAGTALAWRERRLRASMLAPTAFLAERNGGANLPAAVDIALAPEGSGYAFLFEAKGGGSANRTTLDMAAPALLDPAALEAFLQAKLQALGAAGCPPYRVTCVLGGASPSEALRVLELAGAGLMDALPETGPGDGSPLRDRGWEGRLLAMAARTGVGAQWGGSRLAVDARAIRLPRHAASLPLAVGVRCAARRRARAIVCAGGYYLERLEADPARLLPASLPSLPGAVDVDLDRPLSEVAASLAALPAGSFLRLSGTIITARDAAHARFHRLVAEGKDLPDYLRRHPIFYVGPTEAGPGMVTGSFGPTTAGRMDSWMGELLERGAALVTIAKGGRSAAARAAIAAHGGAYLGAIGGAAALAGKEYVVSSEIIDHADLGMEAVRRVVLRNLPVLLVVDARGRDFYAGLQR